VYVDKGGFSAVMTKRFSLDTPRRTIPCKVFLPEGEPGQIILGVHGFAGDMESSVLKKLGEALCEAGKALICFDFPAHGSSTAPDSHLRVDACQEDFRAMAAYIRSTYPGKEYGVFATSFGGYITLLCADFIPDFRMVLRAPAVTMAETFIRKIIPCSREEFLDSAGAWCGFERKMFVSRAFYEDLLENPPEIPPCPLLILHGTEDDVIYFEAVRKIADTYPNVTLIAFPGADHRFKNPGEAQKIVSHATGWFADK
jgi:alpha-beta hydrolase superfamily lysophospholipase